MDHRGPGFGSISFNSVLPGRLATLARAGEHRNLQKDGYEPALKNSRWRQVKRWENLSEKQEEKSILIRDVFLT